MPSLRPPKGYKRGFTDQACQDMAERALASPLGQEALRQGWGDGLYRFVMAWGSMPTKPETKAALHRAANDFKWDLADMRRIQDPDPVTKALINLYEARAKREADVVRRFLKNPPQ